MEREFLSQGFHSLAQLGPEERQVMKKDQERLLKH